MGRWYGEESLGNAHSHAEAERRLLGIHSLRNCSSSSSLETAIDEALCIMETMLQN